MRLNALIFAAGLVALTLSRPAYAEKQYGPGVTDTEIKIGQTAAFSGPASAFGLYARSQLAYYQMINAAGGINGRKITMLSLDDGFSPPKTVEQVRKLVEEEKVLAIMGSIGSPTNLVVAKYLNANKVPQLLVSAGTPKLVDPVNLPWTTTFYIAQPVEAAIYAQFIAKTAPNAKLGVLYQNDDYGKGYLNALKAALGDKAASMIVKEVSYELSDPTIDSQIVSLQASGADTFFDASTPKFAAQAIRKAYDIGWKPLHVLIAAASQIATTLKPAGLDHSVGIVTAIWYKQPGDPNWASDKDMQDYYAFMKKWAPSENADDALALTGVNQAQIIIDVLKACGDNLTRDNLLKQATNIKDLQLPLFVPGVKINVTPTDHVAWRQARMAKFDGTQYVFFGDMVTVNDVLKF